MAEATSDQQAPLCHQGDQAPAALLPPHADSGLHPAWHLLLRHPRLHLAADLSEDKRDFCSASVVIRRFLSLSAACKELRWLVATEALPALAARLPQRLWTLGLTADQDQRPFFRSLCHEPDSCDVRDLCGLARDLGLPIHGADSSGALAQLAREVLRLNGPFRPPLELLMAVAREKEKHAYNLNFNCYNPMCELVCMEPGKVGCAAPHDRWAVDGPAHSYFSVRVRISQAGVTDEAGWRRLQTRLAAEQEAARQEAARRERQRLREALQLRFEHLTETCLGPGAPLDEARLAAVLAGPRLGEACLCSRGGHFSGACAHRLCQSCCQALTFCSAAAAHCYHHGEPAALRRVPARNFAVPDLAELL